MKKSQVIKELLEITDPLNNCECIIDIGNESYSITNIYYDCNEETILIEGNKL